MSALRQSAATSWAAAVVVTAFAVSAEAEERAAPPLAAVVARALGEAIVARDPEAAAVLCAVPVDIDGQVARDRDTVARLWARALANRALRGLRLEEVTVLSMAEARERFGPPPARLGPLPEEAVVAVLRMTRSQLVAVLGEVEGRWAVIAVTD